jgi:hypothetical protein
LGLDRFWGLGDDFWVEFEENIFSVAFSDAFRLVF